MKKAIFGLILCISLFALGFYAEAETPKKIPSIGYLRISPSGADSPNTKAFLQDLNDLGYVEGRNIVIEWRSGEGNRKRAAALAADLLRLKVKLVVTGGAGATRILKEATSTTPIVMANDADPIGMGFITSLARPGGNITGLSNLAPELGGKRLEILTDSVQGLSRVALIGTSTATAPPLILRQVESAASALGIKFQYLDILGPKDVNAAFRAAVEEQANAVVLMLSGPIMNSYQRQIIDAATRTRLPTIYDAPQYVERGGADVL